MIVSRVNSDRNLRGIHRLVHTSILFVVGIIMTPRCYCSYWMRCCPMMGGWNREMFAMLAEAVAMQQMREMHVRAVNNDSASTFFLLCNN